MKKYLKTSLILACVACFSILTFTNCKNDDETNVAPITNTNSSSDSTQTKDSSNVIIPNDKDTIDDTKITSIKANDDVIENTSFKPSSNPLTILVLDNDKGDNLSIKSTTISTLGEITISNNTIIYTPKNDNSFTDNFSYTIIDDLNNTSSANINITITVPNNKPTIQGVVNIDITSDKSLSSSDLFSLMNDKDGDKMSIISVKGAVNGTLSMNGTTLSYTPTNHYFIGSERLIVIISDGKDTNEGIITLNYTSNKGKTFQILFPNNKDVKFEHGIGSIVTLSIFLDGRLESNTNKRFWIDGGSDEGTWTIDNEGSFNVVSEIGSPISFKVNSLPYNEFVGIELVRNDIMKYLFKVWNE